MHSDILLQRLSEKTKILQHVMKKHEQKQNEVHLKLRREKRFHWPFRHRSSPGPAEPLSLKIKIIVKVQCRHVRREAQGLRCDLNHLNIILHQLGPGRSPRI